MTLPRVVQVEWVDSSLQNHQVGKDEYPKPASIATIGMALEETEEYITIARDSMGDGEYRGLCCIPMRCVEHITPMTYTVTKP